MGESKCPECGSAPASKAGEDWLCGTTVGLDSEGYYLNVSRKCLCNQLTTLRARVAELEAERAELREAIAIAVSSDVPFSLIQAMDFCPSCQRYTGKGKTWHCDDELSCRIALAYALAEDFALGGRDET